MRRRRRPRAWLLAILAAVACRGPQVERPNRRCTHVQSVREYVGGSLCEDVWTCGRPPGGPFDRLGLHRLAPCEDATGPVVLYLPGMHMNGELPIDNPRNDLRLYLATEGVRTWGLDYRTHAVPADASAADLAALKAWTDELFLDDVAWAAAFVRTADPGPLVVAGFSQGAALAYRYAARAPGAIAGLVVLDGASGGATRSGRGGSVAIDVGGSRLPYFERTLLMSDVIANPNGPSRLPGYPSAGAALADILYTAASFGGHGGLSNARDGVSDVRVVATLLRSYDRWWPRAALDAKTSAPPPAPLPLIAFASMNIGPQWVERVRASAQAFGGPAAPVHELPGYGHLDVLVGRNAARDVFEPVLLWLGEIAPS